MFLDEKVKQLELGYVSMVDRCTMLTTLNQKL